jgi:large subunit ribosomal protein L35
LFAGNNETRREYVPKMKTHQGAAGRFEVRKNGKLRRRRSGHNHMLEKKSSKRKRRLNTETVVNPADRKRIKRLMGVR